MALRDAIAMKRYPRRPEELGAGFEFETERTLGAMKKGSEAKGKAAAKVATPRPSETAARAARSSGIDLETVRELARIATELNL